MIQEYTCYGARGDNDRVRLCDGTGGRSDRVIHFTNRKARQSGNRALGVLLTLTILSAGAIASFCSLPTRADGPGSKDSATGGSSASDSSSAAQPGDFAPSNVQTEDGKLIPVVDFFPSTRCQNCHADTHAMWSQSLHRNAAREPFYRESVDILLHTRGIEPTRHCESCHTPVALLSGALSSKAPRQEAPFTPLDDEGVTCSVCHSIVAARLDGTGSFTIRRPALLAKEDGTPIFGNFTDEQILADIPAHKRAVMRPLLRSPEFCEVCHKVDAPPDLNQYKHIRGFSAYDEWQQSGASLESVTPFYPRDARADCRTCHMPKVESLNDRAAKNGMIASHRWLGANTVAPLFYGQTSQVEQIESFLKSKVLDVDIFALRPEGSGSIIAALDNQGTNKINLKPGESVTAEVVVSNRTAAHTFPPEVRDLYEAWVQFEVIDESGKTIFNSGFVKPDGMLDESAHVYRQIILDKQSRPITRHQIWLTNIKAYDNTVPPGRSDIARFRFEMPEESGPITLKATVNYRRVNHEYSEYVLSQRHKTLSVPIVSMAEAEARIEPLGAHASSVPVSLRPAVGADGSSVPLSFGPDLGGRASSVPARLQPDLGAHASSVLFLPAAMPPAPREGSAFSVGRPSFLSAATPPRGGVATPGSGHQDTGLLDETRSQNENQTDSLLYTAKRWNDYGIGLLEQKQFGPASDAFLRAADLDLSNPSLLVNAAIAEMGTERFGPEHTQFKKAEVLLNRALRIAPENQRARFYRAIVWRGLGRLAEAAQELEEVAAAYPRDREVHRQLGQTLYSLGKFDEARAALETVISIDPTDAAAYQLLSPLYQMEGRTADAQRAQSLYLQWREDPMADTIATRFFAAHPQWTDERVTSHVHSSQSPSRPILTGQNAAPVK